MKIFFILGWFFVGLALLAAISGVSAYSVSDVRGAFLSWSEVWQAHWPQSMNAFQTFVSTSIHPALWDPVLVNVFKLPGWLLAGVPGAALVWRCHPARLNAEEQADEDSVFLYDELVKQANKDGYDDLGDTLHYHYDPDDDLDEEWTPPSDDETEKKNP